MINVVGNEWKDKLHGHACQSMTERKKNLQANHPPKIFVGTHIFQAQKTTISR